MSKIIDRSGIRYGRLVVISRAENNKRGQSRWKCVCDYGETKIVEGTRLQSGMTRSCGCLIKDTHRKVHFKDLTGIRVGRLTVLRKTTLVYKQGWKWLVRCDCGTEREYFAREIREDRAKSCGCYRGELISIKKRTHGKTNTRAYWMRSLAKKRARENNIPFDISIEFVERLIDETTTCPYLGTELKTNKGKLSWNSATMDRIIPSLGYIEGNVMLISHRANTIKNDASPEEILRVGIGLANKLGQELPELIGKITGSKICIPS
jgi:hypothetical protein